MLPNDCVIARSEATKQSRRFRVEISRRYAQDDEALLVRHHIGVDAAARDRQLRDAAAVIARHHDRIA